MSEIGCEKIIPNRSKHGEPVTCGKAGRRCRLRGGIASVLHNSVHQASASVRA